MGFSDFLILSLLVAAGTILVIIFVAWVTRAMLDKDMTKKLEFFNQTLKEEMDRTLDEFKSSLNEQKMIFNTMQEKKTEKLVQLYAHFTDVTKEGRNFTAVKQYNELARKSKVIAECIKKFFDFYHENEILFSDELCDTFDKFIAKHDATVQHFNTGIESKPANEQEKELEIRKLNYSWCEFEDQVPTIRSELKKEYNKMVHSLGTYNW